jgi:hypothetical protein
MSVQLRGYGPPAARSWQCGRSVTSPINLGRSGVQVGQISVGDKVVSTIPHVSKAIGVGEVVDLFLSEENTAVALVRYSTGCVIPQQVSELQLQV